MAGSFRFRHTTSWCPSRSLRSSEVTNDFQVFLFLKPGHTKLRWRVLRFSQRYIQGFPCIRDATPSQWFNSLATFHHKAESSSSRVKMFKNWCRYFENSRRGHTIYLLNEEGHISGRRNPKTRIVN